MGWDGFPVPLADEHTGRVRSRAQRVRECVEASYGADVIEAFDYATGIVFLALRDPHGEVRPACALVECADEPEHWGFLVGEDPSVIMLKDISVDESPDQWPVDVMHKITRWAE